MIVFFDGVGAAGGNPSGALPTFGVQVLSGAAAAAGESLPPGCPPAGVVEPGPPYVPSLHVVAPRAGTLRRLSVRHNRLGVGPQTIRYEAWLNGVATGVFVALGVGAAQGLSAVAALAVAATDRFAVLATYPDGPITASPQDVVATLDIG